MKTESGSQSVESLLLEVEELRRQLYEANETIEAIRTGQVDALVVQSGDSHELYSLKTADQAYRVFIEKMTEGAITLSRDGIILYANSQFAVMAGQPLSAIIGLSLRAFITTSSLPVYEALLAGLEQGDNRAEVDLEAPEGPRPVQLSLTVLDLEDDVYLSIILTDLTLQKTVQRELQQNNQQLEQLNRTLEASNHDLQQFASIASHDLQEPLRKINMFANLLRDRSDPAPEPAGKVYLDKIINAAVRMRTLIVDVLNYSKLSAGDNNMVMTDIGKLIREVSEDYELVTQEKQAAFEIGELPSLEVNAGQMRQVFQNLLSNALKFSRAGIPPCIRISGKRIAEKNFGSTEQHDGPFCLLSFGDNGIGFDDQYAEHVFSLFERLHPKDVYEGSGIGLAITRKIIEKHHGLVTVSSKAGEGTEFRIILPVHQKPWENFT